MYHNGTQEYKNTQAIMSEYNTSPPFSFITMMKRSFVILRRKPKQFAVVGWGLFGI